MPSAAKVACKSLFMGILAYCSLQLPHRLLIAGVRQNRPAVRIARYLQRGIWHEVASEYRIGAALERRICNRLIQGVDYRKLVRVGQTLQIVVVLITPERIT